MNEDIKLRTLEKTDLEFLHQLNNNAEIMMYWFAEPYHSMEHLQKRFDENIQNNRIREFIVTKEKEQLGYVGLFSIDLVHRNAEFGIMIDPTYQGYGYARTATNLAMEYAFLELNLHKLSLVVAEMNDKAIHIYKQAGFETEGVLKDQFFVNGSYQNALLMSIFQTDYVNKKR